MESLLGRSTAPLCVEMLPNLWPETGARPRATTRKIVPCGQRVVDEKGQGTILLCAPQNREQEVVKALPHDGEAGPQSNALTSRAHPSLTTGAVL